MKVDLEKLLKGDRRTLSKAITLIESTRDSDKKNAQDLIEKILPYSGKSFRLGISGVPGVGKSSFIESFGQLLIKKGFKVAVLAVDPSSPITGGSIMGDKTRMEKLAADEGAFIRPTPAGGMLGGVANKTRETMLVCEAAGFDYILVETVGVGQSEFEVQSMVDFFMVLMLPNAGDELQGIKKGILELTDAVIVNKADGDMETQSEIAVNHYQNALHFLAPHSFWTPITMNCSSLTGKNLDVVFEKVESFKKEAMKNNYLNENRSRQNKEWFKKLVQELIEIKLGEMKNFNFKKIELEQKVVMGEIPALKAAQELVEIGFNV